MLLQKTSLLSSIITLLALVSAKDPTPAERQQWDAQCIKMAGKNYRMTFDANGKPTGRCEAPVAFSCYANDYLDPKTGAKGCCGTKGPFTTDPNYPKEGGCCKVGAYTYDPVTNRGGCCSSGEFFSYDNTAGKGGCCSFPSWRFEVDPVSGSEGCCAQDVPRKLFTNPLTKETQCCQTPSEYLSVETSTGKHDCCKQGLQYMTVPGTTHGGCCASGETFSFDTASATGGCCEAGKTYAVDAATGQGGCCPGGLAYTVDSASGQGGCCAPGTSYKVDTLTGKAGCCSADADFGCECACNPQPTCPGGNGVSFKKAGKKWRLYCNLINHGANDLGSLPKPDTMACTEHCAGITNCVRAIYNAGNGICYLRTHGNKDVPVTPDPYESVHLVEDDSC